MNSLEGLILRARRSFERKGRLDPATRALKSHSKVILDPQNLFENRLETVHRLSRLCLRSLQDRIILSSQIQWDGISIMTVAYHEICPRPSLRSIRKRMY